MNRRIIKLLRNAWAPGANLSQRSGLRTIVLELAPAPRRSSDPRAHPFNISGKAALGTLLSLLGVIGLFGCQSAQEPANATPGTVAAVSNPPAPKSQWPKMVTVPAGTALLVSLDSQLQTDLNKTGDSFRAHTAEAVRVDQMTVIPAGSEVRGQLTLVEQPHYTAGKAQMTLSFDQVMDPAGNMHSLSTSPIVLVAAGDKITDEEKVAGGAVVGGLIGLLTSPKQQVKGAAVGAAAGAAAGGVVALSTKGKQMVLPAGKRFTVNLNEPIRVSVTQLTASK